MTKKIRLTESQLVNLIEKIVKENQMVGMHGFKGETQEVAKPVEKENKPKKEKSVAQKYYDKIISTKNELEKLNDSLTGEKNMSIKNKFRQIEMLMKELQSTLGKREDVNSMK
jgi:hypothetical protein